MKNEFDEKTVDLSEKIFDNRKHERINAFWSGTCSLPKNNIFPCKSKNISLGGAQIESDYCFNKNQKFILVLEPFINGKKYTLQFLSEARHVINGSNGKYLTGLIFLDSTQKSKELLLKFTRAQL